MRNSRMMGRVARVLAAKVRPHSVWTSVVKVAMATWMTRFSGLGASINGQKKASQLA